MIKLKLLNSFLVLGALLTVSAPAQAAFTLDFERVQPYPPTSGNPVFVSLFYAGGSSTIGTAGSNYGATFANGGIATCLNSLIVTCGNTSRGGLGDPSSQRGGLQFDVDDGYINISGGFGTAISFYYLALGVGGFSIDLFDGTNGTGNLLGTGALPNTPQGSCVAYNATYCPFEAVTLAFSGTAKSVRFNGPKYYLVLDDISFGDAPSTVSVPEPATWAMMLLGFGTIGFAMRRRRVTARFCYA
jgi:hypothetical protein